MSSPRSSAASGWPSLSVKGVVVRGPQRPQFDTILTNEAVQFLADLHRKFEQTRRGLLSMREHRQVELDRGVFPEFLPSTASIRADPSWRGPATIPADLLDRRVEITGPVDRKMIINALNSGARVFMADFEDSSAPTWDNLVSGQINMRDAVNRTITFAQGAKSYALKKEGDGARLATLMVRPRGWHLPEAHVLVDGDVMSGSLFDFGLFFFHNAKNLVRRGSGPYFYLPKMESHVEARLWNDVFLFAQARLGLPRGTIRATVLIETITAAFEMEEIIYELREHSAGLNCGRWDYIFSCIKKFGAHREFLLPDRAAVTMTTPFMQTYVSLLIATCHKRGVHAMGGMAAQIPVPNNPQANLAAEEKVKADKLREVQAGCDGTWVAHPALIPIALTIFNEHMPGPNQLTRPTDPAAASIGASALLCRNVPGSITLAGIKGNIDVGLEYVESWLRGAGCVPINSPLTLKSGEVVAAPLMEDAATAEISRCQLWQWIRHSAVTAEGQTVTRDLVRSLLAQHVSGLKAALGEAAYSKRKYELAQQLFERLVLADRLEDFLTLVAYPHITDLQASTKIRSNM